MAIIVIEFLPLDTIFAFFDAAAGVDARVAGAIVFG